MSTKTLLLSFVNKFKSVVTFKFRFSELMLMFCSKINSTELVHDTYLASHAVICFIYRNIKYSCVVCFLLQLIINKTRQVWQHLLYIPVLMISVKRHGEELSPSIVVLEHYFTLLVHYIHLWHRLCVTKATWHCILLNINTSMELESISFNKSSH